MNGEDYLLPDYYTKRILILGCGNRLFGDDGFGPAVIDHLCSHYEIPDDVYVMDVGTGVRKVFLTLRYSERLPQQIVIVDAVEKGKTPGEIFELSIDDIPKEKKDDFFFHQAPSSNLAKDLKTMGVDIHVLACQVAHIPDTVEEGLSQPVAEAAVRVCEHIARKYSMQIKH